MAIHNLETTVLDFELTHKTGVILIKPDAVELGIAEDIIDYANERVEAQRAGSLEGVYLIDRIGCKDIPSLYPNLSPDGYGMVENYLCTGSSVMAVFRGTGHVNMRELMLDIKGKRMRDWTLEELEGKMGMKDSIRGMLPVPGTISEYADAVAKLKAQKSDPSLRFTDEEFKVYCKNLIHSPDDLYETVGVLSLLSKDQLRESLSPKGYLIYKELV